MVAATAIADAVARLDDAAVNHHPCSPVRELIGSDDISTAYRVQSALIARRIDRGARRIGRKIGLTSSVVQRQLGVAQPDCG